MAPPVLRRKLKKVQEMRTDTPAMLEALDALSTFFQPGANTLEARRGLRGNLEQRGLQLVEEFLGEFEPIQARIELLQRSVDGVHVVCNELLAKLEVSADKTSRFASATKALADRREQIAERAAVMDNFLKRFKLSDSQLSALSDGPREADDGALFFSALEDVQRIRDECQTLISSQYQSAGLELFEAMAAFQEQAYDRLYGWVQSQCVALDAEFPDPSDALQRGIATLAQAPAYHEHARDCIAETRSHSLARRFATALSAGSGATGRPIEMHAHDPLRYVGDMLAWTHQSLAVEKSLVAKLFPPINVPSGEAAAVNEARTKSTLSRIFEGIDGTLSGRIRQVLSADLPLLVSFKLVSLLSFYCGTFGDLSSPPPGSATEEGSHAAQAEPSAGPELFVSSLSSLHDQAREIFFDTIRSQCDKLLASPPAYPRDLSVALEVSELIRRLADILAAQNDALAHPSGPQTPQERETHFAPILDAFVAPLLQACRQSASGLDRADAAVYIINNLVAIQTSLTRYDFTVSWVQRLTSEIGDWIDLLVKEQAEAILSRSGLKEKIEIVHRADPGIPLAAQSGMDLESLKQTLDSFYRSMFSLVMPEFDRLVSPRLRANARNSTAQTIAAAYEELFGVLSDSDRSGFSQNQLSGILLHDAQQVRQLLDA